MSNFSRRTIVRGTAWSVPVVAIAAHAPAFAASAPPINLTYLDATKCPGQSSGGAGNEFTYVFHFRADSVPAQNSVTATSITVNGVSFAVDRVVIRGLDIYVVTSPSSNSADASGGGTITYTSGVPAQVKTVIFTYDGSHPDVQFCRNI